ncbi:MAG: DUF2306 domain-containing protein [Planctomycetes bacterium]|nr:DUF2306 domain-containing protein [Planctomycetota bacterium]
MLNSRTPLLQRILALLAVVVIVKVTVAVVLGYREYIPPDFNSDFLHGRESYFAHDYQWAFYPHIISGPVTLILGLILISNRFRTRFPQWHRRLGRVQVFCVLLLVSPSGLWMAWYAAPGPVAGISFAILSVLTGACVVLGWQAAVKRRFAIHRVWMGRCFVLLCSAVVLRVVGGLGSVGGVQSDWYDPLASWASWVVPLVAFEMRGWRQFHHSIRPAQNSTT